MPEFRAWRVDRVVQSITLVWTLFGCCCFTSATKKIELCWKIQSQTLTNIFCNWNKYMPPLCEDFFAAASFGSMLLVSLQIELCKGKYSEKSQQFFLKFLIFCEFNLFCGLGVSNGGIILASRTRLHSRTTKGPKNNIQSGHLFTIPKTKTWFWI